MLTARTPKPEVHVHDVSKLKGQLKIVGGSMSDDWNNILANQTVQTLWLKSADAEEIGRQRHAAVDVLIGIAPRDEFEGMIAAQLHRRAQCRDGMLPARHDRRADVRGSARESEPSEQALAHLCHIARRAQSSPRQGPAESHCRARPCAFRRPGSGRHGRDAGGRGSHRNQRNNPMQSNLPMHLSPRCGARTRSGRPCRSPAMPNGRCRMHGGTSPGAPKGNKNACKHGRYTAEAIARRRSISTLIRAARSQCSLAQDGAD